MESTKQLLVFDFDGVISNSIHDSLMTALNTYLEFVPNHELPIQKKLMPKEIFQFEKQYPEFFDQFARLMPIGNFAQDYFVIIRIIEKNETEKITSQSIFNDYKNAIPKESLISFQKLFYKIRTTMQADDPKAWADLNEPFPEIVKAIQCLSQTFICAIATSKDKTSVNILLDRYGIAKYFRPENILDKDFAESKRAHLIRFHEEHNISFSNMHFIDDKVSHLLSVKDLCVHAYLALWGFNTEREQEIARKEGFISLRLENLPNL